MSLIVYLNTADLCRPYTGGLQLQSGKEQWMRSENIVLDQWTDLITEFYICFFQLKSWTKVYIKIFHGPQIVSGIKHDPWGRRKKSLTVKWSTISFFLSLDDCFYLRWRSPRWTSEKRSASSWWKGECCRLSLIVILNLMSCITLYIPYRWPHWLGVIPFLQRHCSDTCLLFCQSIRTTSKHTLKHTFLFPSTFLSKNWTPCFVFFSVLCPPWSFSITV